MSFQTHCHQYLQQIHQTRATLEATPELSLLPHLHTFLQKATADHFGRDTIKFTQEPKTLHRIGRPDIIAQDKTLPIGYIETEAYGRDLHKLTGHAKAQNHRFTQNLDNFILTNFTEFQLWREGALHATAQIETETETEVLETLLDRFLSAGQIDITSPEILARYLARRTRELQTQIKATLTDEDSDIYRMFSAFKMLLLTTLTPDDFADMYAQTLAYGLFAARCTLPNGTQFSRYTAAEALPKSNPFLVQLFYHIAAPTLERNVTYILDDIAVLLRGVSTEMLRTAFAFKKHLEDPVIHFYETFLEAYDPARRVARGVYYTPPQVVSYIVRSVDTLLKTELRRPDGLADDTTLILDPATGTGSFLLRVLGHIREAVIETYGVGEWGQYVKAQLVKRLLGFELLVAPYTIAHLKTSLFLQAQGWQADERLRIYLTNTLEDPGEQQPSLPLAGFISDEANAALAVKTDEPLLVILGNPPYPRDSANPSRDKKGDLTFIGTLIEDYKQVDGKPLNEKNTKALQADYVKFIRWAQWRIDKNGEGVIGYIVNNSFLDGPTFRGMRQSLLESFGTIYLLNLHGSSRKQEANPIGEKDENVFDIIQGVTLLFCVKHRDNPAPAKVYHADLWGTRAEKYSVLSENSVQSTSWAQLGPTSPYYLFVPQKTGHTSEYEKGWGIRDIFYKHSTGIVTARDKVTFHRSVQQLRETITDFVALPEEIAREKYKLGRDSRDWKVQLAQADLRQHPDDHRHVTLTQYRPFDTRWTYYTGKSRGFHSRPRGGIMQHIHSRENLALCVCRIVNSSSWQHALVTDKITENRYVSNRGSESGHVFPLYLYPDPGSPDRLVNLKPEFLTAFAAALRVRQIPPLLLPEGVSPEEILAYIYAVLYSPTYRTHYYDFLKYDFPRIPLPTDIQHFRSLATLGQHLINWHLLRVTQVPMRHRFEGEGEGIVASVRYADKKVWINENQYFTDVPETVWRYEIGAYQVCQKWLRDRHGQTLSHAEVRHYRAVLIAIAETLHITPAIDEVLCDA